jgi:hypothetical protein
METLNLNPDPRLQPAPERTAFDYAVSAARVGGLAFPFLGTGATLFDLVTAPLRGKRLSNWLEELRLRLNELSQKVAGLTPESLAASDAFISAFAQATQAALRTQQAEKLEAFRNGLLNVAAGTAPQDDQQLIFLHLIDRFTPHHLKVLAAFAADVFPPRFIDEIDDLRGSIYTSEQQSDYNRREDLFRWVRARVPDVEGADEGFIQAILTDLSSAGLTTIHPEVRSIAAERHGGTATEFGRAFLRFVSPPPNSVEETS